MQGFSLNDRCLHFVKMLTKHVIVHFPAGNGRRSAQMATNKSEAAEQRRARLVSNTSHSTTYSKHTCYKQSFCLLQLASSIKVFLGDWDRATAPAAQGSNKGSEQTPSKAKAAPGPQASKSKKSVPLDAKDEAMAKLMRDLDDKVNTAKR